MKLQRAVWEGDRPEFWGFLLFIGCFAMGIFFLDDIPKVINFIKYECLFCFFGDEP